MSWERVVEMARKVSLDGKPDEKKWRLDMTEKDWEQVAITPEGHHQGSWRPYEPKLVFKRSTPDGTEEETKITCWSKIFQGTVEFYRPLTAEDQARRKRQAGRYRVSLVHLGWM